MVSPHSASACREDPWWLRRVRETSLQCLMAGNIHLRCVIYAFPIVKASILNAETKTLLCSVQGATACKSIGSIHATDFAAYLQTFSRTPSTNNN